MLSRPFRADSAFNARAESAFSSPFPPKDNYADLKDSMDLAGQTALDIISRAASNAKENNNNALNAVQELTLQLQAANHRIKELEIKVEQYQVRAERAERWFGTISSEIQRQFMELVNNQPEQPSRPPQFRIANSDR